MLAVFAQAESARMRTYRHAELRGEQQHGEGLAESAETAIVKLAEVDRARLHQLLEHHAIGGMLSGRDADRLDCAANRGVTEDVVGAGGLFDPQRVEARERAHELDRLADVPRLVRIHHHSSARSNLFP